MLEEEKTQMHIFVYFFLFRLENTIMISFGICALFLIATVSAIPAPSGIRSAIIYNNQKIPVRCIISHQVINTNELQEPITVTIGSYETKTINEKIYNMGSWTAAPFISKIQCGNSVLLHPFKGVSTLEFLWKFEIASSNLLSVGPTEN